MKFCANGKENAQVKRVSWRTLIQEEALQIAKQLEKEELTDFAASNG